MFLVCNDRFFDVLDIIQIGSGEFMEKVEASPKIAFKTQVFTMVVVLTIALTACGGGGGTGSGTGGTTSTGGTSGGNSFQARPFPGDYSMRLPSTGTDSSIPSMSYNPVLKEVFASNPNLNTVEVYSTVDGHRVGSITVPGPAGLSFSPDYSQLVVGTITDYVYFVNPSTLHIVGQVEIPTNFLSETTPGTITNLPVLPFAMADGYLLLGMGGTQESGGYSLITAKHLVSYDPSSGAFSSIDPTTRDLQVSPVRSGDGKYLLVEGLGDSGSQLFLYSTAVQGYLGVTSTVSTGSVLVANLDGSQFASIDAQGRITLLNTSLQPVGQFTSSQAITNAVYSRDGKYLYWTQTNLLVALNAQTASLAGYLGISIGLGVPVGGPTLFDIDENARLFGAVPGGVVFVNVSQLQATSPPAMAQFVGSPATFANPNSGPVSGGTEVQFIPAPNGSGSADGIFSSMQAYFGSVPAAQDVVAPFQASSDGGNFLTATAPAPTTSGPVSVLLTDANNNAVLLPDAYTYGPHILRISPNVVSPQGGDLITVYAYGLPFVNPTSVPVTIAGTRAQVLSANPYAGAGYPEQSITVIAPPGTAGWADVTITTANGADTSKRGVQYLEQTTSASGGPFTFAVYDAARDRFYLSGADNTVGVFDSGTMSLLQPLQSAVVSSGAVLDGEALTPDNSKLLVSDPTDHGVVVFDLVAGTSSIVNVLLPSDPAVALFAPMSIVAATGNQAFVSLTPCIPNPVREIDLTALVVRARPDATSLCSSIVYPQFGSSSADGSLIVFGVTDYASMVSYAWRYDATSDLFTGPTTFYDNPWAGGKAAVSGDGMVLALNTSTVDQRLLPLVPNPTGVGDTHLNKNGSLLYTSFSGVSLFDTRNGRQLLSFPPVANANSPYRPLAIDPTGQKVLFAHDSSLSYYKLSVIPLAIGSVSPARAASGTSIIINGSGFLSGTTVTIGGQAAACTLVDSETLQCVLPALSSGPSAMTFTNPDGQTYSVENAVTVQ